VNVFALRSERRTCLSDLPLGQAASDDDLKALVGLFHCELRIGVPLKDDGDTRHLTPQFPAPDTPDWPSRWRESHANAYA